jgi:sugar lactone lactonase YvrE
MKFNLSILGFCFAALLTACGGGDPYDAGAQKVKYLAQASTFVGNGNPGFMDGLGSIIQFSSPNAVALASNGDLYVGDSDKVRMVTPAGVVSLRATIPRGAIYGLAVDADGNIFATSYSNEIFKISTANPPVVTVFAGSIGPGFQDSPNPTFNNPRGMVIDRDGNLYIADRDNHAIRKITPAGVVSTVAGTKIAGVGIPGSADGTGSSASFNYPAGITVDTSGNLYVADTNNELIRKISPSRVVTTVAGSGALGNADGSGAAASFDTPQGLTMDSNGNLIVADTGNHNIRTVTPLGVVTTLAGYGSSGLRNEIGARAKFNAPIGIAVGSDGTIYIADNGNYMIRLLKMIWI